MAHDVAALARELFSAEGRTPEPEIVTTLARYGAGALSFALRQRICVVPLRDEERYRSASRTLARLGIDVDRWPAPPAGLFVVEERALYLRSRSPMTVAHEFGHALDCALGGGVYRSGIDPRVRALYCRARAFVTPYAATGIDEYFAESLRAYVGVNDPSSQWPRATRERLRRIDAPMCDYVGSLFVCEFAIEACV
jgi:hypothetical protein